MKKFFKVQLKTNLFNFYFSFLLVFTYLLFCSYSYAYAYEQVNSSSGNLTPTKNIQSINTKSFSIKPSHNNSNVIDVNQALKDDGEKIAFLTFDDGPTPNITPQVLSTLDKYNVKATFFVIGYLADQNKDILKQEFNKGHSIGNHTLSHNLNKIYSSPQALLNEIDVSNKVLKNILGNNFSTKLVRFPGGSFGRDNYKTFLNNNGYDFIDWNVSSGDAAYLNVPSAKIIQNIKKYSAGQNHIVILMHDAATKQTTAQALPTIIEYLKSQGYTFKTLR